MKELTPFEALDRELEDKFGEQFKSAAPRGETSKQTAGEPATILVNGEVRIAAYSMVRNPVSLQTGKPKHLDPYK